MWKYFTGLLCCALVNFSATKALLCPHPEADVNTRVVAPSLEAGSSATYSCDTGYELFGSPTRVCGGDGKWTGKIPMCATNVAWRKPVNQSSTARGGDGINANDGDKTTVHDGNKCTQTTVEDSPWWSVDLLQEYEIAVVRITTRGCCDLDDIQDLEVRIGDSENVQRRNRLCAWHPGTLEKGTTKELTCDRPMKGRYVFVQMVGKVGALSLCEVEVFSKEEISKDRCQGEFDLNKLGLFNQTCYEFQITSGGTYDVAKKYCENRREGTLVHGIEPLTNKFLVSELERLKEEIQTRMLWIGVQKEPQFISRVWKWVDGSKVEKPSWGREQPNNYNGEQNCVVLDGGRDWMWNDVGCNLNYLSWICQFKPSCGTPDRKENTTLTLQPTADDTRAVYECPVDSKVIGSPVRSCSLNGFWSGEAPTCKYINCGLPKTIQNGVFSLSDRRTTYSAKVTYVCAENYTMDGNETITCGDASQWEPDTPKCLYSWCPEIEAPMNGSLELIGLHSGDSAYFACDPGFFLVGSEMLTCELGGKWSNRVPECHFVDCGVPETLENGKMTLVNRTTFVNSIALYECDEDFWLDGLSVRMCESTGHWAEEDPSCKRINCGEPSIPIGGYLTGYSFDVNSEVEYHCEAGHFMTGESMRQCKRSGRWSGESPNCTFIDCGRLPPIIKGEIVHLSESESTYLDSRVEYKCMPNFQLFGDSIRECLATGQWSGEAPKCEEIRCSEPEHPKGSRVNVSGNDRRGTLATPRSRNSASSNVTFKVGTQFSYRCERGYVVSGPGIRTCMANGTWSAQAPECKYVDCGQPAPIEHGELRLLSNETFFGSVVTYECKENWKVDGRLRRHCQENGTWSGPEPQCVQILCPSLSEELRIRYKEEDEREIEPWNKEHLQKREKERELRLEVSDADRRIDSQATYSCSDGQKLVGKETRDCKQHGVWDGVEPRCEWIFCSKPENIENGRVHATSDILIYGSVVEYFCLPKFTIRGPFNRTCTSNGTWSGVEPTCTVDDTNLSGYGDNTIDGTSNLARGPGDETLQGSSYTGIYVGVAVSLILALSVGLALLFFKTRERRLAKSQSSTASMAKTVGPKYPEPMTYGDLNDPTTGNNIYEHIPEDINTYANMSPASSFSSTPPNSYKSGSHHTYSTPEEEELPTYANDNFSQRNFAPVNGRIPLHISQRPRMPPPQPPQVPATFRHTSNSPVSGVTVNGVTVNDVRT